MKVSKIIISGRAISQALWFMAIGPALGRLRKKNHDSKTIWVTQFQKETLPFFFFKVLYVVLFYFRVRVSYCSPGWPQTHGNPSASISQG